MLKIVKILILMLISMYSYSQTYTSEDDYSGYWDDINSWVGSTPNNDDINLGGGILTINGFIKWETDDPLDSTLTLTGGGGGDIIINDTLVIYGNLHLGNKYNLSVNGILIVYGNITTTNKINIASSGYLIVSGDMDFGGSQGGIEPGDETNVYIGGDCTNGDGCASTSNDTTDLDGTGVDDFYEENDPDNQCPETGSTYNIPVI